MIVDTILQKLDKLDTYEDTEQTRLIMTDIVSFVLKNHQIQISTDIRKMSKIWNIMHQTEFHLEKKLWNSITESLDPTQTVKDFIYFSNYNELMHHEMTAISRHTYNRHMLFVWWGPVPLSAILVAWQYWIHITIIDNSSEAVEIAKRVIQALRLWHLIDIIQEDICTYSPSSLYDTIVVASMVFTHTDHDRIIQNIKNLAHMNTSIIIRTTNGIRRIFYKPVSQSLITKYFNLIQEFHPPQDSSLLNSFYLCTNPTPWALTR